MGSGSFTSLLSLFDEGLLCNLVPTIISTLLTVTLVMSTCDTSFTVMIYAYGDTCPVAHACALSSSTLLLTAVACVCTSKLVLAEL